MNLPTKITVLACAIIFSLHSNSFAEKVEPKPLESTVNTDYCTVKGLFYTVQIGVFSKPINEDLLPEVMKPLYCLKREDGNYAYFTGIYDSRFEAMRKRYKIASGGQYDAYVAVYYNGEQISMYEADELLAVHGDDILYNAIKAEDVTQNVTE